MTKKETIEALRDKVADIKWDLQSVLDNLDRIYHEFESKTMTKTANVGRQFMEIMKDYMERQEYDSFDVAVEIDDLYTDLSNLYYNNIND